MSNSRVCKGLRAGTYLRQSDEKQEHSIERQRSQVDPYVLKREYVMVGEYVDEGIAGDEFEKRPGLQRLLRDAKAGMFDVIVSDEPHRFSRQNPIEFIALVAHPLRAAGVTLDTVASGPQGWDDVVSIITLTIQQDRSSGESKTLSRRVLTGAANLARAGRHLGGPTPYGFIMRYSGDDGRPVGLVADPEKAKVVVWLYEHYDRGWSLLAIAAELNKRCAPAPERHNRRRAGRTARPPEWTWQTVRYILKNTKYTGALVWNQNRRGKFHRLIKGEAVPTTRAKSRRANDVADWLVTPEQHEALVSRELFDRVAQRLADGKSANRIACRRGYVLSGLVVCGFCGRVLTGKTRFDRPVYMCRASADNGETVCGFPQVPQDAVLNAVASALQRNLLDPVNVEKLRAAIRRQEEAEQAPSRRKSLERQLQDLARKVARGTANLALLPPDLVPGVAIEVGKFRAEHDAIARELDQLKTPSKCRDLEAVIAETTTVLWELREAIHEAEPERLRDVLARLVHHVEVRWERQKGAKRWRYKCLGGTIYLRTEQCPSYKYGQPYLSSEHYGMAIGFTAADMLAA